LLALLLTSILLSRLAKDGLLLNDQTRYRCRQSQKGLCLMGFQCELNIVLKSCSAYSNLQPFAKIENGGCCLRISTEEEVTEAHIRTKIV